MNPAVPVYRIPGPGWGSRFLLHAQRHWPRWIYRPLLEFGTWIAVVCMTERRRHSREFLAVATGRRAGWTDVWRHFLQFVDVMLLKFSVRHGQPHTCRVELPRGAEFEALAASVEPALFGTFHFGHSDLIGFELTQFGRRVAMVRLLASDAPDIQRVARDYPGVTFIWSNDPANMLFDLKAAIDSGHSLALQCDRIGFSAKTAVFRFLGADRVFPFTIYHLAILFERPVVFCVGLPDGPSATRVHASPVFRCDPKAGRDANLAAAQRHFQSVLAELETLVRQYPLLWFNFLPLNPEAPQTRPAVTAR